MLVFLCPAGRLKKRAKSSSTAEEITVLDERSDFGCFVPQTVQQLVHLHCQINWQPSTKEECRLHFLNRKLLKNIQPVKTSGKGVGGATLLKL